MLLGNQNNINLFTCLVLSVKVNIYVILITSLVSEKPRERAHGEIYEGTFAIINNGNCQS